jgi:pilus assembly protein CpaC
MIPTAIAKPDLSGHRRTGCVRFHRAFAGSLCLAATLAVALQPLSAQAQGQLGEEKQVGAPTPFKATARDLQTGSERMTLALNGSAIIETTLPTQRVQAVDPNTIFVQSISPTQILVTGVGTGVSQIIVWSDDGQQSIFQVTVDMDLTALNAALSSVDPLSSVKAIPLMGNVVLTGTASSTEMSQRLSEVAELFMPADGSGGSGNVQNQMVVAGEQQVLLRVTVAELSRGAARELGINGFLAGENFRDAFVVNQLNGINPANIGALQNFNVRQNFSFGSPDGIPLNPAVPLSLGFPRVQMQVFINALAENSLVRILAEPNLVTVSGETASFLAGGEFPIPVPQGVDQVTIEFREFGARLNFTPVVMKGQRIRMHVAPELSQLDFTNAVQVSGFVVPGLTQRRMETTVEVGNGQTLAIAGLLNDEVRGVANRIPGIGDVPVLGALFRSVSYQRNITEMVVLVTPEIIAPLNPNQVPKVPGSDHQDPNDFDLYALGLLEGSAEQSDAAAMGSSQAGTTSNPDDLSVHGPWGHETEMDVQ